MPTSFLAKDLEDLDVDIEDEEKIGELAQRYNVSVQAMTFRLSRLGLVL